MSHAGHYTLTTHQHKVEWDWKKRAYVYPADCNYCDVPQQERDKVIWTWGGTLPSTYYNIQSKNPFAINAIATRANQSRAEAKEKLNTTKPYIDPKVKASLAKIRQQDPTALPPRASAEAEAMTYTMKIKGGRRTRGRHLKGTRAHLNYNVDVDEARLLNREREYNFEKYDVEREFWECYYEDEGLNWDEYEYGNQNDGQEPAIGCYEACYQVDWNSSQGEDLTGLELDDEELRALGILYDSEDESAFQPSTSKSHPTIVPSTPMIVPLGSPLEEPDLDDLWVVIQGRRVASPAGSDWEVVSEF